MQSNLRKRANTIKSKKCKNSIVVLENPKTIENIASTLRNINALGAEKLYIVDGNNLLKNDWQKSREIHSLNKISASAIKWTYYKKFNTTKDCLNYLKLKGFNSLATSPHIKGKLNFELKNGKYTDKKLAIWFGNESKGLSEEVINNSKFCINIEMNGIIEGLNLGTTTGIVLYEVTAPVS